MKQINEMSDQEFAKKIIEEVGTPLLFDEVLSFQAPSESQYGSFLSNFYYSLINHLSEDAKYSRGYEYRMAQFLYYEVKKVKIYCILRHHEEWVSPMTKIYIAFEGNPDDVFIYCDMITNMYHTIIKETYDELCE